MTLQTLKRERHQQWRMRKQEKQEKLKQHIRDMERKLDIYRKYKDGFGVSLNKKERENVFNHFDATGVEVLMGRKLFTNRQVEAAVRIQAWWRKSKFRQWFSIIVQLRVQAAIRIQRSWRNFVRLKIWPLTVKRMRQQAAVVLQRHMKGYVVHKRYYHELSLVRMHNCFDYFDQLQHEMQENAIRVIVYYMRRYLRALKLERMREAERKKKEAEMTKKRGSRAKVAPKADAVSSPDRSEKKAQPSTKSRQGSKQITVSQTSKSGARGADRSDAAGESRASNSSRRDTAQKSDNAFLTSLKRDDSAKKSTSSAQHQGS